VAQQPTTIHLHLLKEHKTMYATQQQQPQPITPTKNPGDPGFWEDMKKLKPKV